MKLSFPKKWFLPLFKFFSITTVAFAFQACYGAPRDFGHDALLEGTVVDTNGVPVEGISIFVNDTIQYALSDSEGKFRLYLPLQETYNVTFLDKNEQVNYMKKDTAIVSEGSHSHMVLTVKLDKK